MATVNKSTFQTCENEDVLTTDEVWPTTTSLVFKLVDIDHDVPRHLIHLGNVVDINDLGSFIVNPIGLVPHNLLAIEPKTRHLNSYFKRWPTEALIHDTFVGLLESGEVRVNRIYEIHTLKITSFVPSSSILAPLNEQPSVIKAIEQSRSRCVYVITGVAEVTGISAHVSDCRLRGYDPTIRTSLVILDAGRYTTEYVCRSFCEADPIAVGYSLHCLRLEECRVIAEPVTASSFPKKMDFFEIV